MRLLTWSLPFLLLAASGCFGTDDIRVQASEPLVLTGYAYDGRGIVFGNGSLEATLRPDSDTGEVRMLFRDPFRQHALNWSTFVGRTDFQSGGIARNLDLWGASGNGSAVFPKVRVHVAAFGTARYEVDGAPQRDPSDLRQDLSAILFVTQGRFRDPDTYKVENAGRSGLYDPAKPTDGYINLIGAQVVVLLFTQRGDLYRHFDFQDVTIKR